MPLIHAEGCKIHALFKVSLKVLFWSLFHPICLEELYKENYAIVCHSLIKSIVVISVQFSVSVLFSTLMFVLSMVIAQLWGLYWWYSMWY